MARPIVLAVDGQAREILESGECGVFVPPEDSEALAAAVRRLVVDAAERRRLGFNGHGFVRKHYDRRALAQRYLEIVAPLLTDPASRRAAIAPLAAE